MHRKILSLAAAAAVAAAAFAPAAMAQDAGPKLEVTGAYLVLDKQTAKNQTFVRLVFRTAAPLPRRFDGSIRAGAKIEGVAHSIGSARRGASIYTALQEVKSGRIVTIGAGNKLSRKAATIGASYKIEVFTRDGQSVTKTLKLRAAKPGDLSGKPLAG